MIHRLFLVRLLLKAQCFLADSVSETEPITISVVVNRCELKKLWF